jgi:pimeloyl-ACP methyl ester carboxylesterase
VPDEHPRSHAFDANGIRLMVHGWGGTGTPVLLAHPTGFHGRIWAPIAHRLVAHSYDVWSFDFRGHGDSDAPSVDTESYSWQHFADDALAVAHHLDLAGRADLIACGHSKGGASLLLGEASVPGTYARIWAYEPIMFPSEAEVPPEDELGMATAARRRRNEWPSIDAAFESYASKPPMNVMQPEALRAYVEYGLRDRGDGVLELKCRPEVEARIYAMGARNGLYARLATIAAPVRVVCGGTSTDISPALGARIVERLPAGSLEVMVDRGHFGPQEDPDETVASILRFADATAADARATPA